MNIRWLHRFALLTALATLSLIGLGGLVTSHGVGMAVPDWPNTYGYNMFLFPISQWLGGVFYEHTHRLLASLVGLLTTVLALWLWARETRGPVRWAGMGAMFFVLVLMGVRQMPVYLTLASLAPVAIGGSFYQLRQQPRSLRWWGVIAFAAVILQGVLGGLRVVWYKDQIGVFHAALAQLFFVLTCAVALFTSHGWQEWLRNGPASVSGFRLPPPAFALRRLLLVTTLLILGQLILGATMRHQHAGLAISDFPLAYGKLWPAMDPDSVARYNQQRVEVMAANPITAFQIALQMVHRLVALLILLGVSGCAWLARRRLGATHPLSALTLGWLGLIGIQVLLGAATIWSNKAADVATVHVLAGALSLAAGAILSILVFRDLVFAGGRVPAAEVWPHAPYGPRPWTATQME
ncbi:MAG TPA: COX15/CtaA family protein [Candidatus Sulfotelmatobacter sp.]|nr:COX15/CtaA family protein [Candidatus Sulfotelmatobacter sp.]